MSRSRSALFAGGGKLTGGLESAIESQRNTILIATEPGKPIRIVIVEDDPASRNMLVSALQAETDCTVVADSVRRVRVIGGLVLPVILRCERRPLA